jgi:ATP-dependent DNA helicase RecQ
MPINASTSNTPTHGWTIKRIRDITQVKFGKRPCWYQVQTALAIYEGKDVIGCAPTGAGKTLSFWIPLLMAQEDGQEKTSFVVTPLNLLGEQNVKILKEAGLPAIAVSKENAKEETFKVSCASIHEGREKLTE